MPSILPNYEYDIFISYRQNDNKRDKWVTQFVEALRDELEATLKNPVSIYFDENPHDGLLETHDVDRSLEKKLKCLIFIPIISQTYCDATCFAWEHELVPFIAFANKDELGMNITLANGNVASRILPIRIHDIDSSDISLYEQTIGGHLRPIDFVYKEKGVNRPLKPVVDDINTNEYHTVYRNQINKVANALKELGVAVLRNQKGAEVTPHIDNYATSTSRTITNPNYLRYVFGIALIIILGAFGYWKLTSGEGETKIKAADKSLAILPFKNMSGDANLDHLGYALKGKVHSTLALGKHFAFMSSQQATFPYAKIDKTITQIGDELNVDYILSGFYQVLGDQLEVTVELADAETGFSLWTFPTTVNYAEKNVLNIQKQIAEQVMSYFESENKENINEELSNSSLNFTAYKHYIKGQEWENQGYGDEAVLNSIKEYEKAIELDSMYLDVWQRLVKARSFYIWIYKRNDYRGNEDKVEKIQSHIEILEKDIIYLERNLPNWVAELAKGIYEYQVLGNFETGLTYLKKVHAKYPNNEHANSLLSAIYKRKLMPQKSADHMSRVVQIDPLNSRNWRELAMPYRTNGDYEKVIECITIASELDSTYNRRYLLGNYMAAGYTLEELPQDLRTDFEYMITWKYSTPQELLKHIDTLKNDEIGNYFSAKASLYYAIEEDDSVKYYANELLLEESHWWWEIEAHAYLGNPSRAIDIQEKEWFDSYDNEDLLIASDNSKYIIQLYVLAKQYQKATELLIQMNNAYPELGDYVFFNGREFDRIKKEYPPFMEALDNLKLPPPLLTGIKLDRSKR